MNFLLRPMGSLARDFDASPCYQAIKPMLKNGFDYQHPNLADRLPKGVQHGINP